MQKILSIHEKSLQIKKRKAPCVYEKNTNKTIFLYTIVKKTTDKSRFSRKALEIKTYTIKSMIEANRKLSFKIEIKSLVSFSVTLSNFLNLFLALVILLKQQLLLQIINGSLMINTYSRVSIDLICVF